tara:strand:- start:14 stop:283 length:270 start_codon:yes stop_codon:yes gene_type:complete
MDESTNEFVEFLETNRPFVHIILGHLFNAVQGKYTKMDDEWTKEDTQKYIDMVKRTQKSPEVIELLERIDTLENIREIQSRIIDNYRKR